MMRSFVAYSLGLSLASAAVLPRSGQHYTEKHGSKQNDTKLNVQVGDRPYFLVDDMDEGPLKEKLESCSEGPFKPSDFVFAHRGASLQFPEHTYAAYSAARRQGAGVIECDVAFTADNTTLAEKCTTPFTPANGTAPASAKCCTSDLTVAEFQTLCGKQDGCNPNGTTVEEYMDGTPYFRTDLYASGCPKLITLNEYIDTVNSWDLKFTAELKTPEVKIPFNGYTQEQYAQDMIDAFKAKNIAPERVWPQSFLPADIFYWIDNEPEFGAQAVYLDERVDTPAGYANATASLPALAARGVKIVAPAMFALTKVDNATGEIVPSEYAVAAQQNYLEIVAWGFERSGWLQIGGGGYYYDYVKSVVNKDGHMYKVLDVLARQVKIKALFSDWPATVTYYANCFGL
ncbi:PLC-like phosphodiesterase [Lizonia empirigonia]|nr:PLC-like phosphodiesterase [Lizonia empirigonia]